MTSGRMLPYLNAKRRLRWWLILFFLALTIPAGILIHRAYSQLKWETFHRHRVMAEEFATRIDHKFSAFIHAEEVRNFGDYEFLVVAGDPGAGSVQRSKLSTYPVNRGIPGLIGYFQIDTEGGFSTPLLPRQGEPLAYGISNEEVVLRQALENRILAILHENRLVQIDPTDAPSVAQNKSQTAQKRERTDRPGTGDEAENEPLLRPAGQARFEEPVPASPVLAQEAFDQLGRQRVDQQRTKAKAATLGRVADLKLEPAFKADAVRAPAESVVPPPRLGAVRAARKESSAVPEQKAPVGMGSGIAALKENMEIRISMFESEIDAFEFSVLDSGHFVLFRKVWRDGQRYIQGGLIEAGSFFEDAIAGDFRRTALSAASDLAVAYDDDVFSAFTGQTARPYLSSTDELTGSLLYKTQLSAPLGDVALIFSITRLPPGPGSPVISWATVILLVVLCGGLVLMYRLGAAQIDLTRQQQDFVSAVSHELKTPLTSIRMYGEILREGWAGEEKRKTYYDYIFNESERLSRLIANILQLARMARNEIKTDLKQVTVSALLDGVCSKISSQVEQAGFALDLDCGGEAGDTVIEVDPDAFSQIMINLVDNAIKFSANAEQQRIEISCFLSREGTVRFRVRDYGPGIARDQIKKIFALFYRSENELTRDTAGTGIGLALVHQLTEAMNGHVEVVNREPGAEFIIDFPVLKI